MLVAGMACALTALAWLLSARNELNHYDQYFALIWGRELADGQLPDYETTRGSTPHPLTVLVAAALAPAGQDAAREMLGSLNLLAWAVIVVGVGLIGARLLNRTAGVAGAVAVAVNANLFDLVGSASADAFFAALLVAAVTVETYRPRAGAPVLVLLAVAGLSRPEAWLFAAAYWLWLYPASAPRRRVRDAALVLAAPLLWMASDTLVTGEPLFSLTRTQRGARGFRPTGVEEIVPQLRAGLSLLLDVPEAVGAAVCAALLWHRRAAAAAIPAAVVVCSLIGFAALGVAEVPMLPRYLLVAGALVAGAGGWAIAGWTSAEHRRVRIAFAAAAVLVLALFASRAPGRVETFDALQADQRYRNERLADLRDVLSAVSPGRCPIFSTHLFKSAVAYELELPPDRVRVLGAEGPIAGLVLVPTTERGRQSYVVPEPEFGDAVRGADVVSAGSHWRIVDSGCRAGDVRPAARAGAPG